MSKKNRRTCNHDCFNCTYDDCIVDDLVHADYLAEKDLDAFAGVNEPKESLHRRKYKKKYREEHIEQDREYQRKYYQEHAEHKKEATRKWTRENKERAAAYGKEYRAKNKEYFKEYKKKYYQEHKEHWNDKRKQRQQAKKKEVIAHD